MTIKIIICLILLISVVLYLTIFSTRNSPMNVKIKSITVGRGDCFFLCLNKGDECFNVMIDCMKYTDEVKAMVEGELQKHINLLVVSHIDDDHVPGVTTMFNEVKDLEVDEIWFNSYQRTPEVPVQQLTDYQKQRLIELKGNLPIVADVIEGKVDSGDARLLSEAILEYEKRVGRKVWKREYICTDLDDINLGKKGEWGKIHFLSPTKDAINELDKEFRKMFRSLFYDKHDSPLEEDVCIYELMMQYLKQKQEQLRPAEKVDAKTEFTESSFLKGANLEERESRIENIASIAFVWSFGDHKILFAGDAEHKQLCDRLEKDYQDNKPIVFDAVKVSHHGSNTGTSKELMKVMNTSEYFIPCGTKYTPSLPTMAKLLSSPLPDGVDCRHIHYNKATANIALLKNNSDKLSNLPKFELTDGKEYEFTC